MVFCGGEKCEIDFSTFATTNFTLVEGWVLFVATANAVVSYWTIYLFSFLYAVGDNYFDEIKLAMGINNHQYAFMCGVLYCIPAMFAAQASGWVADRIDSSLILAGSSAINVLVNSMYYMASVSGRYTFFILALSHVLMGAAAGMQKVTSTLIAERVRLEVIGKANGIVWVGPYLGLSLSILSGIMCFTLGWIVMCEMVACSCAASMLLLVLLPGRKSDAKPAAPDTSDERPANFDIVDVHASELTDAAAAGEPSDSRAAETLTSPMRRKLGFLTVAWGFLFASREIVWAWMFIVFYDEFSTHSYAVFSGIAAVGAALLGSAGSWFGGVVGDWARPQWRDADIVIMFIGSLIQTSAMVVVLTSSNFMLTVLAFLVYLFSSATVTAPAYARCAVLLPASWVSTGNALISTFAYVCIAVLTTCVPFLPFSLANNLLCIVVSCSGFSAAVMALDCAFMVALDDDAPGGDNEPSMRAHLLAGSRAQPSRPSSLGPGE